MALMPTHGVLQCAALPMTLTSMSWRPLLPSESGGGADDDDAESRDAAERLDHRLGGIMVAGLAAVPTAR